MKSLIHKINHINLPPTLLHKLNTTIIDQIPLPPAVKQVPRTPSHCYPLLLHVPYLIYYSFEMFPTVVVVLPPVVVVVFLVHVSPGNNYQCRALL